MSLRGLFFNASLSRRVSTTAIEIIKHYVLCPSVENIIVNITLEILIRDSLLEIFTVKSFLFALYYTPEKSIFVLIIINIS